MKNRFQSAYETLANTENYKSIDGRLKIITWTVATISAVSTAYANGFSHSDRLGIELAILLGLVTFAIVEGTLYTLEEGLRSTFKGGTQRALAWSGKWIIKATMVANAGYLCCMIAGVTVPPSLLFWNRWSFAVHFAIGLILVPLIRDADPVIANRMLQLRAETAQEDQIVSRLAFALASPIVMACVRLRGFLDGVLVAMRLLITRQGFSPKNYVANLNSQYRAKYRHIEGKQHKELESSDNPFPKYLHVSSGPSSEAPLLVPATQNNGHEVKVLAKTRKSGSGGGLNLPDMAHVHFEPNKKGGIEAWFYPPGSTGRKDRTYLKHFGNKLLTELEADPNSEEIIRQMVSDAARQKGIML